MYLERNTYPGGTCGIGTSVQVTDVASIRHSGGNNFLPLSLGRAPTELERLPRNRKPPRTIWWSSRSGLPIQPDVQGTQENSLLQRTLEPLIQRPKNAETYSFVFLNGSPTKGRVTGLKRQRGVPYETPLCPLRLT